MAGDARIVLLCLRRIGRAGDLSRGFCPSAPVAGVIEWLGANLDVAMIFVGRVQRAVLARERMHSVAVAIVVAVAVGRIAVRGDGGFGAGARVEAADEGLEGWERGRQEREAELALLEDDCAAAFDAQVGARETLGEVFEGERREGQQGEAECEGGEHLEFELGAHLELPDKVGGDNDEEDVSDAVQDDDGFVAVGLDMSVVALLQVCDHEHTKFAHIGWGEMGAMPLG
jgi:hypothetical protein